MALNPDVPVLLRSEELPAAPRQARSLEKRKKLLDAARILFAQKGYEATSIEDITSKAGTAAGGFYQFFRSKRQLVAVLMNELIQRLGRLDLRPEAETDLQTGLRNFLARTFRTDVQYYGVVRAWQEAALADPEFARIQKKIEAWTEARILGVFRLLAQLPNARHDPDLPTFARMMDRHFWSLLARGAILPRREFNREIKVAADVIYHHLFRESPYQEE